MSDLSHRTAGYNYLRGRGLEIGAFNKPARLPPTCRTEYFDALTKAEAMAAFPEVDPVTIVEATYFGDLDRGGLQQFDADTFDYVIASHVIEHVANPIALLQEIHRITKSGGCFVVAAPDKRFTFDRPRTITPFDHLAADYHHQVEDSPDDHYYDFLCAVVPGIRVSPPEVVVEQIRIVRGRREHVHVWDSAAFRDFMVRAFDLLQLAPLLLYEHAGDANQFEYFSVWQKGRSGLHAPGPAGVPG